MILGSIKDIDNCKSNLAKALIKGLDYLKSTDFSKVAPGKYEIDGSAIFALVQEYQTAPKSEKRAETHVKYIDIQYIDEGKEVIGFGLPNRESDVQEDLSEQKDVIFYKTVKDEMELILDKGTYAIFFPDEIHRPGCNYLNGDWVRKVVVKIDASLMIPCPLKG